VKIDNYGDTNGNDIAHNNEPHVSCAFGVDAYGYEAAAPVGAATFDQHPPTSGGSSQHDTLNNPSGSGTTRGTGATYNGYNSPSLTLVGSPHPKQGYHVKLTYQAADGNAQGSTVKHKVFWVEPCGETIATGETVTGTQALGSFFNGVTSGAEAAVFSATAASFRPSVFRGVRTATSAQAVGGQPAFTG
jgi:hypothetical protein